MYFFELGSERELIRWLGERDETEFVSSTAVTY